MKYACVWVIGDKLITEPNGFDFFSAENGYRLDDIALVDDLQIGESVDLSDGLSQKHFVIRVS